MIWDNEQVANQLPGDLFSRFVSAFVIVVLFHLNVWVPDSALHNASVAVRCG